MLKSSQNIFSICSKKNYSAISTALRLFIITDPESENNLILSEKHITKSFDQLHFIQPQLVNVTVFIARSISLHQLTHIASRLLVRMEAIFAWDRWQYKKFLISSQFEHKIFEAISTFCSFQWHK